VRRLAVPPLLALAWLVAGCGAERASGPSSFVPADTAFRALRYRQVGLEVSVPEVTRVERRPRPGVFRASFADWFVSAFAYRREEQLPRGRRALEVARQRLIREVQRRGFRLISARAARVSRAPAVELLGDQTVARGRLRTRSLHVYRGRGEYVVEMVAPAAKFRRLDRRTFARVADSVKVTGRIRAGRRRGRG
jgi:hypothetical protein